VEYYEHRLKEWPETLDEAFLEMAKVTPKKLPPAVQANIYALKTAAAGRGEKTKHAGRGQGGRTGYGTRAGTCNKCKEPGHYAYECTAQEGKAAGPGSSGSPKTAN
jgi:hypothetical protein